MTEENISPPIPLPRRFSEMNNMAVGPIEFVCVDIQVMILSLIPNIDSLGSALKASPGLYRAFTSAREKILTSVIYNTYGAEIYPEAVAAARAGMLPRENLSRRQRADFVRDYHRFRSEMIFPALDLHTAISVCQLHWAVQYHIERFFQQALSFVTDCADGLIFRICNPGRCHVVADLSFLEKSRLRRAFFRFQMYGRLFYNASMTQLERETLFANKILPWEIEEIASVYGYIAREIQDTFNAAGEDFLSAFTTESTLAAAVGGIGEPIDIVGNTGYPRGRWAHYYDIRLKGDVNRDPGMHALDEVGGELFQARLKAHMLLSGLGFLRRLFESSGDTRLRMVSAREDFGHTFQPPSMKELLDFALDVPGLRQNQSGSVKFNRNQIDSLKLPNIAWKWAHSYDQSDNWSTGVYHELRIWGYVFWDAKRLKPSGILAMSPYDIASLFRPEVLDWNEGVKMQEKDRHWVMKRYFGRISIQ